MTITCLLMDHDLTFVFATKVEDRPAIAYRCKRGCGLVTIETKPQRSAWTTLVDWLDGVMRRIP